MKERLGDLKMSKTDAYPNIDRFRLVAAILVIAIHTAPLEFVGGMWDTMLTRVLCRVAVPFFFMTSGFFLFRDGFADGERTGRFLRRTAWLYVAATVLYLPLNLYAGQLTFPDILRDVLIDGTTYHLWYFPAVMLGAWIVHHLLRRVRLRGTVAICGLLYVLGLLGDSYWGLTEMLPPLREGYEALFTLFSYTRNGLFMAPLFLALGAVFAARRDGVPAQKGAAGGLILSLVLMLGEGYAVHRAGWTRHDSMYVFLVPCVFFLFALLCGRRGRRGGMARDVAMLSYLLHPWVIALTGPAARLPGVEWLSGQSLICFVVVTVVTVAGSAVLWLVWHRCLPRRARVRGGRPTRIEVDLGAIRHNVRVLEADMPEGCRMMAVVKAQAYGHGAVPVARALWTAGVRWFAVATLEEGVELRRAGLGGEILILGYTDPSRARTLWRYRLTQTVLSTDYAAALDAARLPVRVHIKIDTGMHRIGVDARDTDAIVGMFGCRYLRIRGMFTHLCISDALSPEAVAFTEEQIARFERVRLMTEKCSEGSGREVGSDSEGERGEKLTLHVQSSSGLLNYPYLNYPLVRVGIALYGCSAEAGAQTRLHPDLRPTLAVRSEIVQIRRVAAGECVGYGCTYTAPSERVIATVPIGYADGLPRELTAGGGQAIVRGVRVPMAGRMCMDQLMIDVTEVPEAACGDTVTLIGRDGGEEITAMEVARRCGTITNELLSRMGTRPERVYIEKQERSGN